MFHCEVSRLHFSGSDRLNPQDVRRRRNERFYSTELTQQYRVVDRVESYR